MRNAAAAATGLVRLPARRRQFKAGKGERGSHDATAQGPLPQAVRRLPMRCRDNLLQMLALSQCRAEPVLCRGANAQQQRRARLPDPQLRCIDTMPVTALAIAQQEQDRRAGAADPSAGPVAPRLAVMTALGMRPQLKRGDHRLRRRGSVAQIDQPGSFGTVLAIPGFCANASYHAASFGCAGRHGCAAKRKSR